jgi:hypothetical protein
MDELSPNTRRVLGLAEHADDPTEDVERRVARTLSARIALGGGVIGASALAAKSSLASVALKALLPVALTLGAAGGGFLVLERARVPVAKQNTAPPKVPERAPDDRARTVVPAGPVEGTAPPLPPPEPKRAETTAPARIATGSAHPSKRLAVATNPPEARAREPELSEPVTPPEAPPAPATAAVAATEASESRQAPRAEAARPDPLRAETEALRAAQQALRSGDAAQALELLRDQDRTYARGALHEERAAARVLALCHQGSVEAARAEARRFAERWPRSALKARVLSACRAP